MTATIHSVRAALDLHPDLSRHIATTKISTRRKSLGMSIRPGDSGITLHVPAAHTPADVVATLAENRHRIAFMLHKANRTVPAIPVKELVNGAGFLWLWQNNRLRLVDDAAEAVRHVDDHGTANERGTWRGRWLELDRSVVRVNSTKKVRPSGWGTYTLPPPDEPQAGASPNRALHISVLGRSVTVSRPVTSPPVNLADVRHGIRPRRRPPRAVLEDRRGGPTGPRPDIRRWRRR